MPDSNHVPGGEIAPQVPEAGARFVPSSLADADDQATMAYLLSDEGPLANRTALRPRRVSFLVDGLAAPSDADMARIAAQQRRVMHHPDMQTFAQLTADMARVGNESRLGATVLAKVVQGVNQLTQMQ